MEQEKLAELIRIILSDRRIQELIRNDLEDSAQQKENGTKRVELTLLETIKDFECVPYEWKDNVCCQEVFEGGCDLLKFDQAASREWDKIRIYRPSLNLIAKLATGIADEPILKLTQEKLSEGWEHVELAGLDHVFGIKGAAYRKLFLGYFDKISSFGIKIDDSGIPAENGRFIAVGGESSKTGDGQTDRQKLGFCKDVWPYKALTERDLLDIGKGEVIKIGRKCIVTSLATDMARRKSIRICREGERR